jgi:glutamine synthetase
MAAEWSVKDKNSLKQSKKHYAKRVLSKDHSTLKSFPKLPGSCDESSRILLEKRALYEREDVFPSSVIDYVARLLQGEKDKGLSKKLKGLSGKQRLSEIQKIMHRDLHRH